MSAIRPLATIAMLMVLGWILWTRINTPDLESADESELALADAPAFSEGDDQRAAESSAPPFEPAEQQADEAEPIPRESTPPPAADNEQMAPLDLSAAEEDLPELPPLPDHVPVADYSTDNEPAEQSESEASEEVESVPQETDNMAGDEVPPLGAAPPIDDFSTDTVPLPPAEAEQQAASAAAPSAIEPSMPVQQPDDGSQELSAGPSAFAAARADIDRALAQGDLAQAHLLLSRWYGDRTLSSTEQTEVESLLSQLAGTVIYSTEHHLAEPHRVGPGETLKTIAEQYQVPWQLLAKINGIASPTGVTEGQELKVIRGPFSAVVDVERQQLALMVADRYAGRFSVKTEGQAAAEGEWVVNEKQSPSPNADETKLVVLRPAGGVEAAAELVLGPTSDSAPATAGAIRVGPGDQDDLFDILSIGSRVIIRK